jgi:MSHA biogenesis protein MshI
MVGLSVDDHSISLVRIENGGNSGQRVGAIDRESGTPGAEMLSDLVRRNHCSGLPCVLTLAPGAYNLLQVDRPQVAESELLAALRWKVKDLIDFPVAEAVVDAFDVPPRGQNRSSGSVYAVVAREGELRPWVEAIAGARLRLQRIDIVELSLRNIAASLVPGGESAGLVYLAEKYGMVAITRGTTLYLARSLSQGLDGLVGGASVEIGNARMHDSVLLEFQRTADYYDSNFGHSPVRKARIVPAAPGLQSLADYLTENLGLEAALGNLAEAFGTRDDLDPQTLGAALPALGGALTPVGGGA